MRAITILRSLCRRHRMRPATFVPTFVAVILGVGWAAREAAFAREHADLVASQTVNIEHVKMEPASDQGKPTGKNGVYLKGDTPASTKFVTGRFVIDPGKTPHAPHTHLEEEVMVIESGTGEIFCDGKTTRVGPGSVMYTVPNAPHGIVNTGSVPLAFYYIKWASKDSSAAASR